MCTGITQSVYRLATGWAVQGPNPGRREIIPHPFIPVLGPTQPPIQWIPGLFPGGKRSGRGADHPPSSSTKVKGRVELNLYSPSGSSWADLGWPLPLLYTSVLVAASIYVLMIVKRAVILTSIEIYVNSVNCKVEVWQRISQQFDVMKQRSCLLQ
jgi:hypothetical protein